MALRATVDTKTTDPKGKAKLSSELESLVIKLESHQNSDPFANGATLDTVKSMAAKGLDKIEANQSLKGFVAEVKELFAIAKKGIMEIGAKILPAMAKYLISASENQQNKITALKGTQGEAQAAKEEINSTKESIKEVGKEESPRPR